MNLERTALMARLSRPYRAGDARTRSATHASGPLGGGSETGIHNTIMPRCQVTESSASFAQPPPLLPQVGVEIARIVRPAGFLRITNPCSHRLLRGLIGERAGYRMLSAGALCILHATMRWNTGAAGHISSRDLLIRGGLQLWSASGAVRELQASKLVGLDWPIDYTYLVIITSIRPCASLSAEPGCGYS